MKVGFLLATVGTLAALGTPLRGQAQASANNKNVIMYIGDGFGLAPKSEVVE